MTYGSGPRAGAPVPVEEPVEWFVLGGPVYTLGKGQLENHLKTGWTIQAGFRMPVASPQPWLNLFGEFAGFYASNDGDDAFTKTSGGVLLGPGQFDDPNDPNVSITLGATSNPIDDFQDTRINNLQRAGVQFAVGSYYAPPTALPGWNLCAASSEAHWRLGTRAGAARVQFDSHRSANLDAFLRNAFVREARDLAQTTFISNVEEPELFFGLFASIGGSLSWRNPRGWPVTLTIGADVEVAIDYLDMGAYNAGDNGLASWSPTISFMIAR